MDIMIPETQYEIEVISSDGTTKSYHPTKEQFERYMENRKTMNMAEALEILFGEMEVEDEHTDD